MRKYLDIDVMLTNRYMDYEDIQCTILNTITLRLFKVQDPVIVWFIKQPYQSTVCYSLSQVFCTELFINPRSHVKCNQWFRCSAVW